MVLNDAKLTPDVDQRSNGRDFLISGESLQMSWALQWYNLQYRSYGPYLHYQWVQCKKSRSEEQDSSLAGPVLFNF